MAADDGYCFLPKIEKGGTFGAGKSLFDSQKCSLFVHNNQ